MNDPKKKEYQDRSDATLAQMSKEQPSIFAAFLAGLTGSKRREVEERMSRGFGWLGRQKGGQE